MNREKLEKYFKNRETQAYDDSCGLVALKIICNLLKVETNLSNIKKSFGFQKTSQRFPSYHPQQAAFLLEKGQNCEMIFFSGEKVILDNLINPNKNILKQNLQDWRIQNPNNPLCEDYKHIIKMIGLGGEIKCLNFEAFISCLRKFITNGDLITITVNDADLWGLKIKDGAINPNAQEGQHFVIVAEQIDEEDFLIIDPYSFDKEATAIFKEDKDIKFYSDGIYGVSRRRLEKAFLNSDRSLMRVVLANSF